MHKVADLVLTELRVSMDLAELELTSTTRKTLIKQGSIENRYVRRCPLPDDGSGLSGHLFESRIIGQKGPF